ncbi:hypothetical protein RND71_037932 [Anisodus tanguticus]|uniref:Uncharacterized protein n=1 Tax=Anisodus tanguticus TaxID=243964 RepID=A0AAE1UWI9_9SOLA|nr:hypothetical protein RND71_037932 [Anisodus tanguticus]
MNTIHYTLRRSDNQSFRADLISGRDELKKMKNQVLEFDKDKKLPMKRQFDAGDGDLKKKMEMKQVM